MPKSPAKSKARVGVYLPREYAEEVSRRLDQTLDHFDRYGAMTVEQMDFLLLSVLPEEYADPPLDYRTRADPGAPLKLEALIHRAGRQLSLWHAMDPADRARHEDFLVVVYATKEQRKEWRKFKAAAERKPPPERKPEQKAPRPHYHQGMLRLDDVEDENEGRNPARSTRRGDGCADGEATARVRKCHVGRG